MNKFTHYLMYTSDEYGRATHEWFDPDHKLEMMSFEKTDLPKGWVERSKVVDKHAFARMGHGFVTTEAVTSKELRKRASALEGHANWLNKLAADAELLENME